MSCHSLNTTATYIFVVNITTLLVIRDYNANCYYINYTLKLFYILLCKALLLNTVVLNSNGPIISSTALSALIQKIGISFISADIYFIICKHQDKDNIFINISN